MITINRLHLLNELALLQTVAEKKATIPILSYVMCGLVGDVLTLTATDGDVALVTEVEAHGDAWGGCLPSAQLYALVKLLTDDTITLTLKDNRMQVKAGRAKHLLPVLPISEFPDVDKVESEGVSVDAATFNTMLNHVQFAVLPYQDNHSASNYRFTGVNVVVRDGKLQLAGTNITRFAAVAHPLESSVALDVIIPRQALAPLSAMKSGQLTIDATANYAHFANGTRHLYTRLIDGKFPDWQTLFPSEYEHTAELTTSELGAAIKRALLTSTEGKFVKDGLRWTWSGGELLIETRGGDKGKSDEVVSVSCPSLNGQPVVLGINGSQVVDALGLLGEKVTCKFSDGTNIVELVPHGSAIAFTYYINTVSLKNWA